MLFNSTSFFIFFPVVTFLYFALPHRFRWLLLLGASCCFYMYFIPAYILILGFTIVLDYFLGLLIETVQGRKRTACMVMSIVANVGVLAVFKYFNFANENLRGLAEFLGWHYTLESLSIILPIGLSFHTFQSMSYIIEVYRGNQRAERHFGIYALYVMFYPQLVAGPIERPQNLLRQFRTPHQFDYARVTGGLKLMAWGLFMKVVVADRLALVVGDVYAHPAAFAGPELLLATMFFAFQIYCDFAGYSNIAIGAARVMGFELMRNFDRPYHARSIAEFWGRWHISLSTWFKDYLYIPLGGNRVAPPRWAFNILLVFAVSGLWHGASWTFVVWGLLHGFYLVVGTLTRPLRRWAAERVGLARLPALHGLLQTTAVFALVSLGWVFFRAGSIRDAWYIVTHLGSGWGSLLGAASSGQLLEGVRVPTVHMLVGLLGIVLMEGAQLLQARYPLPQLVASSPWWARWSLYYTAVALILFMGVWGQEEFIYFQF